MTAKCDAQRLSNRESNRVIKQIRAETATAVLIELLVTNPDDCFNLSTVHQPGSDHVAYDGQSVIPTRYFEVPSSDVLRVVFYLHDFDPAKQLATSYGLMPFPPVQDMPKYRQRLSAYPPVD